MDLQDSCNVESLSVSASNKRPFSLYSSFIFLRCVQTSFSWNTCFCFAGLYPHEQQPSTRSWGHSSSYHQYQNHPDETGSTSASETSQRRLSSQSTHTDEGQETASSKGLQPSSASVSSAVTTRDYQGTGANGNCLYFTYSFVWGLFKR